MDYFFRLTLLVFLDFYSGSVFSQQATLSGKLTDKDSKEILSGVRLMLLSTQDSSIVTGATSDEDGAYSIETNAGKYILKITYFSYKDEVRSISLNEGENTMDFPLVTNAKVIAEINVEATAIRVEQKGDTTQYNADAFKTNPDATVEDLVAKMPGITIENGVVKAQGEQIKKVYIDGEEFFGDDATSALKNLPAEIVSKIQIYDNESDQARFTGISDGNDAKALNIVTKPGKNQGQFGKIYAGYGYSDLYLAGANVNFFNGKRKISVVGMSNNVNQQNFASEDILGLSGTSTSSTGGGGRGSRGFGGASENFMVGQQNGVSTTHSIGVNYSDKWGEKTKVTGSYFFNSSKNDNTQKTGREYFISSQTGQLYDEDYSSLTTDFNHRVNFRFEINLDSLNSLVVTPKLSYQGNDRNRETNGLTQDNQQALINRISNTTFSHNNGINAGTSVLWRHKFMKPKRTFSVNLSGNYSNRMGDNGQESMSVFYNAILGDSLRAINQFADNLTNGYTSSVRFIYRAF